MKLAKTKTKTRLQHLAEIVWILNNIVFKIYITPLPRGPQPLLRPSSGMQGCGSWGTVAVRPVLHMSLCQLILYAFCWKIEEKEMSIVAFPFSVACRVGQVINLRRLVILCTFPFNLHEVGCIFVPVFPPPPHEEQLAKHEWKKSVFSHCGTVQILLVSFKSAPRHARKGMMY